MFRNFGRMHIKSTLVYCGNDCIAARRCLHFGPEAKLAYERGDLVDVVYTDDILLLNASDLHHAEYLNAVASAGHRYGM